MGAEWIALMTSPDAGTKPIHLRFMGSSEVVQEFNGVSKFLAEPNPAWKGAASILDEHDRKAKPNREK